MKWRIWKGVDGWNYSDPDGVEFGPFDEYGEARAHATAWAVLIDTALWLPA